MINVAALRLAMRNRALALVVATTGSASLASTANGFSRATGSFLSDGFEIGDEVLPSGFSNTERGIVEYVSATDLYIKGGRSAQGSASGRSLTVGLPAVRMWERLEPQNVDAAFADADLQGRPVIAEQMILAAGNRLTQGMMIEEGRYVLTWYFLDGYGTNAIDRSTLALRALFTPGTALLSGSDVVVRGDTITLPSQPQRIDGGWVAVNVSVPWRAQSTTAAAA
jgi:hypothetical protein